LEKAFVPEISQILRKRVGQIWSKIDKMGLLVVKKVNTIPNELHPVSFNPWLSKRVGPKFLKIYQDAV
jgi:hypothetical protein